MNPSQLRVRAKTNHEVHRIHVRVARHLVDGPLAEEVLQERIVAHLQVDVELVPEEGRRVASPGGVALEPARHGDLRRRLQTGEQENQP